MISAENSDHAMEDFKIDNIKVNTEMAEAYLKKHPFIFEGCGDFKKNVWKYNAQRNKFCNSTDLVLLDCIGAECEEKIFVDYECKLRLLAKKVEENAELFAQLDYYFRKRCTDETESIDIKLIVHNLLYCSSQYKESDCCKIIMMGHESPIATLGFVAQVFLARKVPTIVTYKETAAVCHLFGHLCTQVDLKLHVFYVVTRIPECQELQTFLSEKYKLFDVSKCEEMQAAGLGVITGHSDIDSAVDAFLTSPYTFPWKIRRILVQESVYENLKNILAWKSNLKRSANDTTYPVYNCAAAYNFADRQFVLDCVDTDLKSSQTSYVEAYRTTKELLSLIEKYKAFTMSIWSNDIAEANEIAHSVDAPFVWINDYAKFEGTPKLSQAFYSAIELEMSLPQDHCVYVSNNMSHQSWLQLNLNQREEIMRNVFRKLKDANSDSYKVIDVIETELFKKARNSFVEIKNGTCLVLDRVQDKLVTRCTNDKQMCSALFNVLNGTYLIAIFNSEKNPTFDYIIDGLSNAQMPIVGVNNEDTAEVLKDFKRSPSRTIWTNLGTIFAN